VGWKEKSGREEIIEDVTNILTVHIGHAINKDAIDGIVHYIHVLLGQKDGSDDCAHEAARRLSLKERKEAKNMSLPSVEKVREVLDLAEKYDKEAEDLRKIIEALQVQGYPPKSISTGTHTLNLNQEDRLRGKIATVISEHREDIIGKRDDYIRQISELKGEGW